MKKERYNLAVVGATGAVGNEMVAILEERNFPVDKLKLLASTRGAGKKMEFKGKSYTVEALNENSFAGVDIGLFSAGGSARWPHRGIYRIVWLCDPARGLCVRHDISRRAKSRTE